MLQSVENAAARMLSGCKEIFLSPAGSAGLPRNLSAPKLWADGFCTVFFALSKPNCLRYPLNGQPVSLSYYYGCDSVTLNGKVEEVLSPAARREMIWRWQNSNNSIALSERDHAVFRFTADSGTFWINNRMETVMSL